MEQERDRFDRPRDLPFTLARRAVAEAIETAENKTYNRRCYLAVRTESDNILTAIEERMLVGKREIINGELAGRVKMLFHEINYVLDLISPYDSDRQPPEYPEPDEFTARWASSLILGFEQRRLFDAVTDYEFIHERDRDELPYLDENPPESNPFWDIEYKAS